MSTVTVQVEVDLDEIELEDLVDEIARRIKRNKNYLEKQLFTKKTVKETLEEFIEGVDELRRIVGARTPQEPEYLVPNSLEEEIKIEHLKKVIGKYSISEIEQRLP